MLPCPYTRLAWLSSAIFLSGPLTAQAAELGDPVVRSHIGQPLTADIELNALADSAAAVRVRLARADVYRGASIAMAPVLASLNLSVMQRDGRQYLHITSIKPVEADHLTMFFELSDGGQTNVRAATLWLTADPTPAAPPKAMPAPTPVAAAAPPPAQTAEAPRAPIAMPATPTLSPLRTVAARPAACPQAFSAQQIQTCAVLDQKNLALTAQIAELEDKVRLLQAAVEARRAPPPPPVVATAKPKALPVQLPKPRRALPWVPIGIGVAALLVVLGALAWFLRRKRKAGKAKAAAATPAKPGFMASVKHRLMPGKKEAAEPEPAEPTLAEQ